MNSAKLSGPSLAIRARTGRSAGVAPGRAGDGGVVGPLSAPEALLGHLDHLIECVGDFDAGGLERRDLRLGGTAGARDDRAGVSHPLPGRRRTTGDEAEDGLVDFSLDVLGGGLLSRPADLADYQQCL